VFEVVAAGCGQRSIEGYRPFIIDLGQSPNLVGGQAEVMQHRFERLAGIDRFQKLLPQLGW
jgi:hypothetical protein